MNQAPAATPLNSFELELDLVFRSRAPLVVLVTREEERAVESIVRVCEHRGKTAVSWDGAEGFKRLTPGGQFPLAQDAGAALDAVEQGPEMTCYILKDFHDYWGQPLARRKLRSVSARLKFTRKTIVVVTPVRQPPIELRDSAVIMELPPPDDAALQFELDRLLKVPGVEQKLSPEDLAKLFQAARGLSAAQALRVFAKAIVQGGDLDHEAIDLVLQEKKAVIRESDALEFYAATETESEVGGLDVLKQWVHLRARAFSEEARTYGLPAPKGLALIGIPGTGKSLSAKMIAGLWKLPLLRFDVGSVFGSYVGESEEQTRQALRLAEAVAPCVVWIDEMEKALSHGGNDSGTSTRVFATILTWMQERKAPCFVVATANDISKLPPELLRRGRFDEIFFLDLPCSKERNEIISVHLKKRRRSPELFDLDFLALKSDGFVGSEIETGIIDALFHAFSENREVTTDDIRLAFERTVPMSLSQRERILMLRSWLFEGRAVSASLPDDKQGSITTHEPKTGNPPGSPVPEAESELAKGETHS